MIMIPFASDCQSQTVTEQQSLSIDSCESNEYEIPEVLKAHEILPPELLEGERFSVLEDVLTYGPYRFAPHYGETLTELNNNLHVKIFDHEPNVVDIPFLEPSQWNETKKGKTKISEIDKDSKHVSVDPAAIKN
jgi:hypothetical protein